MTVAERSRARPVRCRGSDVYLANVDDIANRRRGLPIKEEQVLLEAARGCDRKAEIVLLGIYLQIILIVANRYQGLGLDLEEMVSKGQEAFLAAVRSCNPCRLEEFPQFAIRRINQAVWSALPLENRS